MNKTTIFLLSFLLTTFMSFGQYTVDAAKSKMTIDGTSNVHDWTEKVETITGSMNAIVNGSVVESISSLKLKIPVNSIKSGKSGMDKNTYKALKETSHPNISYDLQSVNVTGNKAVLEGNLIIAGVSRKIKVSATYKVSGNTINLVGEYVFKMTDFKIDPPTALMGTIYTGDDLKVKFNLTFK